MSARTGWSRITSFVVGAAPIWLMMLGGHDAQQSARAGAPTSAQVAENPAAESLAAGEPATDELAEVSASDRDQLVAHLVANEGYRVEQIPELRAQIDRMTTSQLRGLIAAFRDRVSLEDRREAYRQWREQSLARLQRVRDAQSESATRFQDSMRSAAGRAQDRFVDNARDARDVSARNAMRPALMMWPQGAFFGGFF